MLDFRSFKHPMYDIDTTDDVPMGSFLDTYSLKKIPSLNQNNWKKILKGSIFQLSEFGAGEKTR